MSLDMQCWPVTKRINSTRKQDYIWLECIEPIELHRRCYRRSASDKSVRWQEFFEGSELGRWPAPHSGWERLSKGSRFSFGRLTPRRQGRCLHCCLLGTPNDYPRGSSNSRQY